MDFFNNRELAIGIWLLAFAAFGASIKPVRVSLLSLWNTLLCSKILTPLFLMLTYIFFVVFVLFKVGFWSTAQFKNTVLWAFTVALLSVFRIPQITEDENYFRTTLKDNFKLIVVFEFVVTFYTFPLLIELAIVPAATLLVTLQAFSETERRFSQVGRLLANILTAFGCVLVLYAGYMLATVPRSFFHAGTLSDFALPIVLSVLFLPFLFVLTLYVHYETLFARINFLYQTESERARARRAALFGFHVRTRLIKRWLRYVQARRPREPDEFRRSVRYVKAQVQYERKPPEIPLCRGWSPYLAGKFLSQMGLSTGDYFHDRTNASRWRSSSKYLDVNGGPIPNTIAFYVEGDEQCVNRLQLVADVIDISSIKELRICFLEAVEQLLKEALGWSAPPELTAAINNEVPISMHVAGKTIEFVKESWPSQRGYELRFYLRNGGTTDTGRTVS